MNVQINSVRYQPGFISHFIDDEPNILEIMTSIENRVLFDARDLFPNKTGYIKVKNWSELGVTLGVANM